MSDVVHRIVVEVPEQAGAEVINRIFEAVADAAHDAEPAGREGWDIFVYGTVANLGDDDE